MWVRERIGVGFVCGVLFCWELGVFLGLGYRKGEWLHCSFVYCVNHISGLLELIVLMYDSQFVVYGFKLLSDLLNMGIASNTGDAEKDEVVSKL